MKYIISMLTILLINYTTLNADESSSFIDATAEFHEMDIDEESISKMSGACLNCHLLDKQRKSPSKWLTPQKSIRGSVENLDSRRGEPDTFSKACLMCHDGSAASLVLNAPISPCGLMCNVDGRSHPVFMRYDSNKGLNNPSSTLQGKWKDAKVVSDLLRDGKVVCISCHVPHHTKFESFLKTSMKNSGLCLGCHNK